MLMNLCTYFLFFLKPMYFKITKQNISSCSNPRTKCHSEGFQTEAFTETIIKEIPSEKLGIKCSSTHVSSTILILYKFGWITPEDEITDKLRVKWHSNPETLSCLLGDGIKENLTLPNFLPEWFLKVYRIGRKELSVCPSNKHVINVCYVPCTGSSFLKDLPSSRKDCTLSLQSLQCQEDVKNPSSST